jgi:integrase
MRTVETRNHPTGTTYRVRFRHGINPTTGKPLQTSETFESKRDAETFAKWLDALGPQGALDKLYAGEQAAGIPTLDEIAADHIRLLTGIEDGTRLGYTRLWARTWHHHLGHLRADQVGPDQVREAVNALARRYATKSLENQRGLLAAVLDRCIEKGHLTRNPSKGIRLPEGKRVAVTAADDLDEDDHELVCLTAGEWDALYAAATPHYRPFVRFLAGTGCRWGEAVALRARDVDLDAGLVRIRRALKWSGDGAQVIGPPKTKKGKRTITLPPEVITDLRPLLEGKAAGELVFVQRRGGMLNHRNFWTRTWKPSIVRAQQCPTHRHQLEAAGCKCGTATPARCQVHAAGVRPAPCGCAGTLLQTPRLHDLRHTHASWLLANGVPIHVVQARLGHESIQTTVDTYGHLLPDAQIAAAAAASAVFAGATRQAPAPVLQLDALDTAVLQQLAAAIALEVGRRPAAAVEASAA